MLQVFATHSTDVTYEASFLVGQTRIIHSDMRYFQIGLCLQVTDDVR